MATGISRRYIHCQINCANENGRVYRRRCLIQVTLERSMKWNHATHRASGLSTGHSRVIGPSGILWVSQSIADLSLDQTAITNVAC